MSNKFVYSIINHLVEVNRELPFFNSIEQKVETNGVIKFEVIREEITYSDDTPKFSSKITRPDGFPVFKIYEQGNYLLIVFVFKATFRINKNKFEVLVTSQNCVSDDEVDLLLLGPVISLVAELFGLICLHASTVVHESGNAIAFLGRQGAGKTTITTSLALEPDFMLVSDDISPIKICTDSIKAYSMHPRLKLWPDSAKQLMSTDEYPVVHKGTIKKSILLAKNFDPFSSRKLSRMYLLEPDSGSKGKNIYISKLPVKTALIELINHSYAKRILASLGQDKDRIGRLALLAEKCELKILSYKHDYEVLPMVIDRIRHEIGA